MTNLLDWMFFAAERVERRVPRPSLGLVTVAKETEPSARVLLFVVFSSLSLHGRVPQIEWKIQFDANFEFVSPADAGAARVIKCNSRPSIVFIVREMCKF